MNFDKRFQNSMNHVHLWTQHPPRADLPNTDSDARNAIVALQAQIQALHAVVKVTTSMVGTVMSPEVEQAFRSSLETAQKIRVPRLSFGEDADLDPYIVQPAAKVPAPAKKVKAAKPAPAGKPLKTKESSPKKESNPKTLTEWFAKLCKITGVTFQRDQVLYQHHRFEVPKIILLPSTSAAYKKLIGWLHDNLDDELYNYGIEGDQRWANIPAALLARMACALPAGAEKDLSKVEDLK